jgi:hypothetical protein
MHDAESPELCEKEPGLAACYAAAVIFTRVGVSNPEEYHVFGAHVACSLSSPPVIFPTRSGYPGASGDRPQTAVHDVLAWPAEMRAP